MRGYRFAVKLFIYFSELREGPTAFEYVEHAKAGCGFMRPADNCR
jgi:hypothetical protein